MIFSEKWKIIVVVYKLIHWLLLLLLFSDMYVFFNSIRILSFEMGVYSTIAWKVSMDIDMDT